MAEPTYFSIIKYIFFIVAFVIAFTMIKNENIESLGVSSYTIILFIFVVSTLVDVFQNYSPSKNIFLQTVSLSGSSMLTMAAAIIFAISIAKLNSTFLENGKPMKLSDTNREDVSYTENMFLISTILILFISLQSYFRESEIFRTILDFLLTYVFQKGTIGFSLIIIGIIISASLLYSISVKDGSNINTLQYNFKLSIQDMSLLIATMVGFMVIYLVFIGASLIAPTIFYMPQINIYLNGLFTLLLSGISIYYLLGYILHNRGKPWIYALVALIILIGILDLFVGGSLLKLSGVLNIGGLLGNLGNFDFYSFVNKIFILILFLFVFSKSLYYYKNLAADNPYKIAYMGFIAFTALFFIISNFTPERMINIMRDLVYIIIPMISLGVSVYLLYLSNKLAPLWRNQVTK